MGFYFNVAHAVEDFSKPLEEDLSLHFVFKTLWAVDTTRHAAKRYFNYQ